MHPEDTVMDAIHADLSSMEFRVGDVVYAFAAASTEMENEGKISPETSCELIVRAAQVLKRMERETDRPISER